jgi:hypothetical protein
MEEWRWTAYKPVMSTTMALDNEVGLSATALVLVFVSAVLRTRLIRFFA